MSTTAPPPKRARTSAATTPAGADRRLPVTVISGFLGSGKTTLLKHLLEKSGSRRIALIVNDMGEVNIDAKLIRRSGAGGRRGGGADSLVELTNGCICCTLRNDLVRQLAEFARSGRFDYAIVESTGIGEPMPVAVGFTQSAEPVPAAGAAKRKRRRAPDALPLTSLARLDTMVTVVDAANFDAYIGTKDTAAAAFPKEAEGGPEAERGVADLLMQQVEFADVIVVNKADKCCPDTLQRVRETCLRLNPTADVVATQFGRVDPERVLGTGKFDFDKATQHPGWDAEVEGGHVPETEEYGIGSFRWVRRRPFHPTRLHSLLQQEQLADGGVLRMKGWVWMHSIVGHYNQALLQCAGRLWRLELESPWMAALPARTLAKELRDAGVSLATLRKQHPGWDDPRVGDRCQDLVVIGRAMDREAVGRALDGCLLTDEEWAGKPHEDDPFAVEEEEDEEDEEEDGNAHEHGPGCAHDTQDKHSAQKQHLRKAHKPKLKLKLKVKLKAKPVGKSSRKTKGAPKAKRKLKVKATAKVKARCR